MDGIDTKLALESLARIYGKSDPALPDIVFSGKHEGILRRILSLQSEKEKYKDAIKDIDDEVEKHNVRIIEMMKKHEHGILETTTDKILIDFVTKSSTRTDTKLLKKNYPSIYDDVVSVSESRKLKIIRSI